MTALRRLAALVLALVVCMPGSRLADATDNTPSPHKDLFGHVDVNHGNKDKHIQYDELAAYLTKITVARGKRKSDDEHDPVWRTTFTMMDKNKDGKLEHGEFHWVRLACAP